MRRLGIYSYFVKLFFLFLIIFAEQAVSNGLMKEYSWTEAKAVYEKFFRPGVANVNLVFDKTDPAWVGLNMDLLSDLLNRTQTSVGSVAFSELLKPLHSTESLEARRSVLMSLIEMGDADFKKLQESLETYAETESFFTHLLEENNGILPNLSPEENDMFHLLPKNMGLKFQLFMSASAWLGIASGLTFELRQFKSNFRVIRSGLDFSNPQFTNAAQTATGLAPVVEGLAATGPAPTIGGLTALGSAVGRGMRAWLGLNLLVQGAGLIYGTTLTYANTKSLIGAIIDADAYVLGFGDALARASNITKFLEEKSTFSKSKLGAKIIGLLKSPQQSSPLLMKAIQWRSERDKSNLYSYTPLFFWDMVEQVGTYDDIKRRRQDFVPLVRGIGELDSFVNVAKLYRDRKASGLPVTLPTFIEASDTVEFTFTNLHNPVFPVERSVASDFTLGREGVARHAVFTGPHACGKTSAIKAIALAHVMAQSVLLVFADQAELSMAHQILTYLNVGDDIGAGLSSFAAEDAGIERIKTLVKANRVPTLIVIDEMYAKTNLRVAPRMASDFLRSMYKKPHVSILLTTHFEAPAKLEEETHGVIKNFQPEVKVLSNGDFDPTFKMLPGSADWWFSDENLMVKFIDWMRRKSKGMARAKLAAVVERSRLSAEKAGQPKEDGTKVADLADEL